MPTTNDFLSKPLLALKQGKNCGIVTNVIFDDNLKQATALLIFDQTSCTYHTLSIDKIKNTKNDAIVIEDCADVLDFEGKALNPINFEVFDTNGKHYGLVNEIVLSKNYCIKCINCNQHTFLASQLHSHSDGTLIIKQPVKKSVQKKEKTVLQNNTSIPAKKPATNNFVIGRKCDKNILVPFYPR